MADTGRPVRRRRIAITGGAGFIGCNLATRALSAGHDTVIIDDLSRPGSDINLDWLRERHAGGLTFVQGDIRDAEVVRRAVAGSEVIYHLAAQTAVTTSVRDPRRDFEINALGTFNVLEAARHSGENPIVIYASTNKVYGEMEHIAVVEQPTRYAYRDLPAGVSEAQPLDFHSPYGCSKGAGDAYTRDYHRIYGLPTVVLRQSCIYGERQMGMEDQGWVAWFALAAIFGLPMTIFGDGKQVRDLLHIDDLLDAFELVVEHFDAARGQVYNLGGGAGFSVSIWREFRPLLEAALGRPLPEPEHAPWRPGDQRIFVADCAKALVDLGWAPRVPPGDGLARLTRWIADNAAMFEQLLGLPSATR